LAESEACLNQAFQFKNSVFGFQFHWEETPETVDNIIAHCQNELTRGPFIQDAEKIRSLTKQYYLQANTALEAFLANL
jgi:hypothetical protein